MLGLRFFNIHSENFKVRFLVAAGVENSGFGVEKHTFLGVLRGIFPLVLNLEFALRGSLYQFLRKPRFQHSVQCRKLNRLCDKIIHSRIQERFTSAVYSVCRERDYRQLLIVIAVHRANNLRCLNAIDFGHHVVHKDEMKIL